MSYSQKHTVCSPTSPASFTWHKALAIHPNGCIIRSFTLIAELHSTACLHYSLSRHKLVDIWVVFSFWQLELNLLKQLCTAVCVHVLCSFLLGKYLGVGLLGCMVVCIALPKKCQTTFQRTCIFLHCHEQFSRVRVLVALHIHQHLVLSGF